MVYASLYFEAVEMQFDVDVASLPPEIKWGGVSSRARNPPPRS